MEKIKKFTTNNFYIIFTILLIFIGIFLRVKGFIINPSLWHDECNLTVSIINFHIEDFLTHKLELGQVAPPLFMLITKLFTNIFGINDFSLRLLPLLVSLGGIPLFYSVTKFYLHSKTARITALSLFVINSALIYYATEFKQYGCDVFTTLLVMYIFNKCKFEKFSKTKLFLTGCGLALLSWLSFVSLLVIAAGLVFLVTRKTTIKPAILIFIPIALNLILYTSLILFKTYNNSFMVSNWQSSFILKDFSNFHILFINTFKYMFSPVKLLLFPFMLFITGFIMFIKQKTVPFIIPVVTLGLIILLSVLNIYPFAERVILFLLPIYILLICKPMDISSKFKWIILFLLFISFMPQIYLNIKYTTIKNIFKKEPAREFAKYLSENINPEDIIFVNAASKPEFLYYSYKYKILNKTVFESPENNISQNRVSLAKEIINGMKGEIWFYMPFDIPHRAISDEIAKWLLGNEKIIEHYELNSSHLLHIKR